MTRDTVRAFVAVEIPPAVVSTLDALQGKLQRHRLAVRWVRPAAIHLTLKFLGDIRTAEVPVVAEALTAATAEAMPISLAVRGLGVFPGIRKARVVWAGLDGDTAALLGLQAAVDSRLEGVGFAPEGRPFRAHLTLGRFKGREDPQRVAAALEECGDVRSERFTARSITLFKSELKPTGAVYTPLAGAVLG